MGDQPANIIINGVSVDLNPPAGGVTRDDLNRRVDEIVNVTRTFSATISSMALNYRGAYDKHVEDLEKLTDDMTKRINDLKEKNAELVKANRELDMSFQRAHGEVAGLIETVENLNAEKRDLQEGVDETSAKFRRLNENVGSLLETARRLIGNVTGLQEDGGKRQASLRLLEGVTERLEGIERFFEDPIALPVDFIPPVPPPLPLEPEATPKPPPAGLARLTPVKQPPTVKMPSIAEAEPVTAAVPMAGGYAPPVNEPAAGTTVKALPFATPPSVPHVTGTPSSSQRSSSPNKISQRPSPVSPQAGEPGPPAHKPAPRVVDTQRVTADQQLTAGGQQVQGEGGAGAVKPPPPGYEGAKASKSAPPGLNVAKPSPPNEWVGAGPRADPPSPGGLIPPPVADPGQRSAEDVERFAKKIIEDTSYRPLYHVNAGMHVVNTKRPEFDVNFRPETDPNNVIALTIKTRNNWRRFKGTFLRHRPREGLRTPGGRRIPGNSGADFNNFDEVFVDIYGQHAYGFLGHSVLKGPVNWRSQLSAMELTKHDEWVTEVGHIQSLFDDGYVPPIHLNDLPSGWFSQQGCPDSQVYVNHSPEMNERQLNSLLLTWAGMLPHGNPTIVSVKHLTENTFGPHGFIHTGVTVIRFANYDLAKLYCRYLNGVQVHYRNFFMEDIELMTDEELTGRLSMPKAVWHQSVLVVELNNEGTMKRLHRDNWPADSVTDRHMDNREKLCWFAWLPCDDFPTWLSDQQWTVNPYTGDACVEYMRNNPGSRPLLKAPHASYWRAIGTYHNIVDYSIKGCDEGCWLNDDERITAYQDDDYYDTEQALNRVATHTAATVGHRALPKARGSRAVSVRRPRIPR